MEGNKKYSFLEAKHKIEAWCAYQDRCHSEVYKKLRNYGLDDEDTNALISHLISYQFLDEQRFAESFVSGKHRIKKWGRNKIVAHLKQKGIPQYCINKGLETIDKEEYFESLVHIAERKWAEKKGTTFEKKVKTQRYLANKGYEFDLIYSVLSDLENQEST
ncbi:RecX family transcriptional regulator [Brumimicrobium salinarum]|uniref:Regulatory protein RecX n=1 Tax=Brumimicrobium salinarum TaxID=2058658 RepID=A0A2I0QZZ5_9FLAO|nr:regulatory protein RecX [Brumimicrobium salinarum]PKR79914.1 RecX family transcriptional regulator [Brumimicrobium salinarum]